MKVASIPKSVRSFSRMDATSFPGFRCLAYLACLSRTFLPWMNTSCTRDLVLEGCSVQITKSASLPSSKLPTLSETPKVLAGASLTDPRAYSSGPPLARYLQRRGLRGLRTFLRPAVGPGYGRGRRRVWQEGKRSVSDERSAKKSIRIWGGSGGQAPPSLNAYVVSGPPRADSSQ